MTPGITNIASAKVTGTGIWGSGLCRWLKGWVHDGDRPPIRVRTGSVSVRTGVGGFEPDGRGWRLAREGDSPVSGLRVELTIGSNSISEHGAIVRVIYRVGLQQRSFVVAVRRRCCLLCKGDVYVRPGNGQVVDRGSELVLDSRAVTAIEKVVVRRHAFDRAPKVLGVSNHEQARLNIYPTNT